MTTLPPTTLPPTTPAPTSTLLSPDAGVRAGFVIRPSRQEVFVRALMVDVNGDLVEALLDVTLCSAELFSESGSLGRVAGREDPVGPAVVDFHIPNIIAILSHVYLLKVILVRVDGVVLGTRVFPVATS